MKRSALVLAMFSCAGLVALATVAQGHEKKYKVTFTKTKREFVPGVGYRYSGTVKAAEKGCVKKVTVQVYIGPLGEYHLIKSEKDGDWEVPNSTTTPSSEYKVEVFTGTKLGQNNQRHEHLCKLGHGVTKFPALSGTS